MARQIYLSTALSNTWSLKEGKSKDKKEKLNKKVKLVIKLIFLFFTFAFFTESGGCGSDF